MIGSENGKCCTSDLQSSQGSMYVEKSGGVTLYPYIHELQRSVGTQLVLCDATSNTKKGHDVDHHVMHTLIKSSTMNEKKGTVQ